MAIKQQRVCDVFPGNREACEYRITITCPRDETALLPDATERTVMVETRDLSQKALDRLRKFILRGLAAPARASEE